MAVVLEALLSDTDDDVLASVAAHEIAARHREPRVLRWCEAGFDHAAFVQFRFQEVLRCPNSEVGVVGYLKCPLTRALRKTSFRVSLDTPSDTPKKELLVIRPAHLTENVSVLFFKLASGHVAQRFNFFSKAC